MKALTFFKKILSRVISARFHSYLDASFFIFRFCKNKELPGTSVRLSLWSNGRRPIGCIDHLRVSIPDNLANQENPSK